MTNDHSQNQAHETGNPIEVPLPDYEDREGQHDWAGLWKFHRHDMTWWRPQHYYFRSALSGRVHQYSQLHRGPMVRPGPLRDVVHLDVHHAVLRSHPETPNALPEELEGMWTDTNPAWPEMSIDAKLGKLGLRTTWALVSRNVTETYELVPAMVEDVTAEESEPFDATPLVMSAILVHVRQNLSSQAV